MLDTVLNQSGAVLLLLETSPTLHHCTKPNKFENTKKIIITNKKERNLRRRKCIHLLDHEESTLQKEIEGSPEKKGCKFRHFNGGGKKTKWNEVACSFSYGIPPKQQQFERAEEASRQHCRHVHGPNLLTFSQQETTPETWNKNIIVLFTVYFIDKI